MTVFPSNCEDSARSLLEVRKQKGPVIQIRVTVEGFDVTFEKDNYTCLFRGMTFDPETDDARNLVLGTIGKIIREDWGIRGPQADQFLEQPFGVGSILDRSIFNPPPHELRLA